MPMGFVTLVLRMICVSTPFAPVRDSTWPQFSCCSLESVWQRVFGRSALVLPSLTSNTDVAWAKQRWPLHVTWLLHFHLRLPDAATMFFTMVLFLLPASSLCSSKQHAVFSVPSSADTFGASFLPSPWVTMYGRLITRPGIRRIPGHLPSSVAFGICRPV